MPNCHSLAVRSTRGLCDACEADFVIRPSVFYEDPATLVRRECPELAAFDNDAAPPLPAPRRTAREVVETGHLAHEMRIVTPTESPKEICVGNGTSPIPIPSRRGPLPLRREEWDEERVVRRRLLEVPAKKKASSTARFPEEREEEVGGGSRSETETAAADPAELRRCQHDNRSLRKQKSVVAASSGGIDAARPKSSSSSPIDGWSGSEYYFDDSNFPSKTAARKDAVETIKEEEGKEKEKAEEAEEGMSACCQDVKDKCESEVSRSLHLRELYKELRDETSSEDEKEGEDLSSSPILSTFHVDSWSGDSLYADLPDLETEYSTSPMTLIFGIPTRIRR